MEGFSPTAEAASVRSHAYSAVRAGLITPFISSRRLTILSLQPSKGELNRRGIVLGNPCRLAKDNNDVWVKIRPIKTGAGSTSLCLSDYMHNRHILYCISYINSSRDFFQQNLLLFFRQGLYQAKRISNGYRAQDQRNDDNVIKFLRRLA